MSQSIDINPIFCIFKILFLFLFYFKNRKALCCGRLHKLVNSALKKEKYSVYLMLVEAKCHALRQLIVLQKSRVTTKAPLIVSPVEISILVNVKCVFAIVSNLCN